MMVTVKVDEDSLVEMLMDRVKYWTDDEDTLALYRKYYEGMAYCGGFNGAEFDVAMIVDNDYINWLSIYSDEELKDEDWIDDDRILAKHNGYNLVYAC